MSRRRSRVVFVVVLLLAVAAAAVVVVRDRNRQPTRPRTAVAAPPRAAVLSGLLAAAAAPTEAGLRTAVATAVQDPAYGGQLAVDVVDGDTGRSLLERDADEALIPASTVKLLTAVAALSALGPNARLTTAVVRSGDRLYLIGGGDVTLRARVAANGYPPAATLANLVGQTVAALPSRGPFQVCVDTGAWTGPSSAPGWSASYFTDGDIAPLSPLEVDEGVVVVGKAPRVRNPADQAGAAFAHALSRAGVSVAGALCHGAAPASGLGLAAVSSATTTQLVQRMLTNSDNDLAESLGRQVAVQAGLPATFAGAAAAVTQRLTSLGLDTTGLRLYDASGLSRLDRVTARLLVQLLQLSESSSQPSLRAVIEGLPVAGATGTLADRYRARTSIAAAGIVRAKTGTLVAVNALAGFVVDRSGRLLFFAFITNRAVAPDATEAALDRLAARLAGCGCT